MTDSNPDVVSEKPVEPAVDPAEGAVALEPGQAEPEGFGRSNG